jgi:NTE family protein
VLPDSDRLQSMTSAGDKPRVGLVLGGGGVVGAAFHAGALAALQNDLHWDPRQADLIVGTSAGSLVGAMLRLGVPADDLASLTVGGRAERTPPALSERLGAPPEFPPFGLRSLLRRPRIPRPQLLSSLCLQTLRRGPTALGALLTLLADGEQDLTEHLDFLDDHLDGSPWPPDALWVCATRRRDGRRTVFGRDHLASLTAAVSASCAVPGYFRPVRIDNVAYVDGGLGSATNANLLRAELIDLAVIVSPMTGSGAAGFVPRQMRTWCQRTLDREVGQLERRGIATTVLEPGESAVSHAVPGVDFMNNDIVPGVVLDAFLDAGQQAATSALRGLLGHTPDAIGVR